MFNLIKASLYKLIREKTFIVTFIVGTVLAILLPLFMHLIFEFGGEFMIFNSVSTSNNFGLTVPINLAVMTIAEFTTGSLRNKIIAGYKRSKIYISLLVSGLVFTIFLMFYYISINVLMGTILGGFDANRMGGATFIWKFLLLVTCSYIFVTTLSLFVSSSLRNIGLALPIIIILLLFLSLIPTFVLVGNSNAQEAGVETTNTVLRWLVPLYSMNEITANSILAEAFAVSTNSFSKVILPGVICSLVYSAAFVALGIFVFNKRDVK